MSQPEYLGPGRWRLYFNGHGDHPRVASLDNGLPSTERTVIDIVNCGCWGTTEYAEEHAGSRLKPCFWINVWGYVTIVGDTAYVHPRPSGPDVFLGTTPPPFNVSPLAFAALQTAGRVQ